MTRRFLRWWVTWAMVGALIAALTYLALFPDPSTPAGTTPYEAASPRQTATGPQTGAEWTRTPADASGRVPEVLATRPTSEEEAGVPSAGLAIVPLARPISPAPAGSSRSPSAAAAGQDTPPSPSSRPASCLSPCHVSVSEWDLDTPEPVAVNGIASHMGAGFPAWYLALPQGPGFIARICGPGGCVTRTSTDAGPSKAMQRYPHYRVADLSVPDFEKVCGVPASFGLCPVSVAIVGRR